MNEKKFTPHLGRPYWYLHYVETEDQFIPDESCWNGDELDKKMLIKGLIYRTEEDCWRDCYLLNKKLAEFRENKCNEVTR